MADQEWPLDPSEPGNVGCLAELSHRHCDGPAKGYCIFLSLLELLYKNVMDQVA